MPEGTKDNNDKLMNALAYPTFGIIGLVLILTKKEDPVARYHGFNGLFLWIAVFIIDIAISIIGAIIPPLGCLLAIIAPFISLAALVYSIILALNVYNKGEKPVIPIITDFAKKYTE